MLLRAISIFSVLAFGLCVAEKLHLPVPTCKRDAPDYSTCLKQAINEAWPLFAKGLPPEFDFPPLDPYFYEYQKSIFDSGELHGEVIITNTTIVGMEKMRFKAVRPHISDDAFRLEIDYRIPKIIIDGTSEAHGTLGGFRMGGKGRMHIELEGVRGTWDISGPVKDDTWVIEHFRITTTVRNLTYQADNIFGGNREINDLAVMFVNEYWPQLYRVVVPVSAEYWDTFFSDLVSRLFSKLSFSEVFP